jgi:hypothetical protein
MSDIGNYRKKCETETKKSMLVLQRLPARLDVFQTAEVLGFLSHEIALLLKAGLLKPLGKPPINGHKFFCVMEILEFSENRDWLDKATRAVNKHWRERNCAAKCKGSFQPDLHSETVNGN